MQERATTVGDVPVLAHPAAVSLESAVLLEVAEPLDAAGVARFGEQLDRAQTTSPECVVVDLTGCAFVDARALTVLLEGHRRARRYGGVLVLAGCAPRVLRLLSLTGLRGVFDLEPPPRT